MGAGQGSPNAGLRHTKEIVADLRTISKLNNRKIYEHVKTLNTSMRLVIKVFLIIKFGHWTNLN